MNKKVMVAMSGGVDSSVAAYLLKRSGFDVCGVTMCLGIKDDSALNHENEKLKSKTLKISGNSPRCCGTESINDAKNVCLKLNIYHSVLDLSSEMEKYIIEPFINQYISGKTPNPCVDCNRFLKFGILLDKAIALGFDHIATGHYAGIQKKGNNYSLSKSLDKNKDQSYFLYSIEKEKLPKILFPLSDHNKIKVREIAKDAGLPVAEKAESQEICFIPGNDYKNFIKKNASDRINKPGNIIDTDGNIIGKHEGVEFYTVGQRKGMKISAANPLYVIKIDIEKNEITAGTRQHLKCKKLIAGCINLLVESLPSRAQAKIRYNHTEAFCTINRINNNKNNSDSSSMSGNNSSIYLEVIFDEPQEAVTPGQSVVFYENDIVLGGGIIESSEV